MVAPESFVFQSDINQLLSLIINTFYKNKEVCFRELISNASDANDKHRYTVLKSGVSLDPSTLTIKIIPDKENRTLSILDNGIGMNKDDLIHNLGTIAKSGTKEFMQNIMAQAEKGGDIATQIGQFGVGFYSAYLIADKVTVVTKKQDEPCFVWSSDANGTFTIAPADDNTENNVRERGTHVMLHLKPDQDAFLDAVYLKELVKKHSEFVGFPIYIMMEREEEIEAEEENENENEKDEKDEAVEDVEEENADKKKDGPKKKVMVKELEHVNKQAPIWTLPPSEVSPEQYAGFYKNLTNDWNDHMAVKHFSVEGGVDMKALLYLSRQAPTDTQKAYNDPRNISLYVKRVFITNEAKDFLPTYFCFVKGVVDCEDLPLNISREFLQNHKMIRQVKKNLTKKTIEMMSDLADERPDDYMAFYKEHSRFLKHGVYEDMTQRDIGPKLQNLLRYSSTATEKEKDDKMRSLKEYVADMKPHQKGIFYMCGDSEDVMRYSPLLDAFKEKNCEVLFMTEPIDEYLMQKMTEFDDKRFLCVSKNLEMFDETEEDKKQKAERIKEYAAFCAHIKTELCKQDYVGKVEISDRVSKSEPCVVTTDSFGMTANMERIMKIQSETKFMMPSSKHVLLNPDHKLMKLLYEQFKQDPTKMNTDALYLIYQSALLTSGYELPNTRNFTQTIYRITACGMTGEIDESDESDELDKDKDKDNDKGEGKLEREGTKMNDLD